MLLPPPPPPPLLLLLSSSPLLPCSLQISLQRYSPGGDLASLLHRKSVARTPFTEAHVMTWFAQILQAVEYVHRRGIIHR